MNTKPNSTPIEVATSTTLFKAPIGLRAFENYINNELASYDVSEALSSILAFENLYKPFAKNGNVHEQAKAKSFLKRLKQLRKNIKAKQSPPKDIYYSDF